MTAQVVLNNLFLTFEDLHHLKYPHIIFLAYTHTVIVYKIYTTFIANVT